MGGYQTGRTLGGAIMVQGEFVFHDVPEDGSKNL